MTDQTTTAQPDVRFTNDPLPRVIQGGMGIAVSDWRLARTVSMTGGLGVVSGTGIDTVLLRRLQDGDLGGEVRRALASFPNPALVQAALNRYFRAGGRVPGEAYVRLPLPSAGRYRDAWITTLLGAYAEVTLAREGHDRPVGLNLLMKLQLHTLPALYGAMLAGVETVIMGAGIPRDIPGVLDAFAAGQGASLRMDVKGGEPLTLTFDPAEFGLRPARLARPNFYPIVSSHVLAGVLARKASGPVQGFIVEGPTAGGHNAPPRGPLTLDDRGQPVYGERDEVDLDALRSLGLPFWLAGGCGTPQALSGALAAGAAGIQVGTLFAFAQESGLRADLKTEVVTRAQSESLDVFTDPLASPTGFPFKVVTLPGTLSQPEVYAARERVCDLGYLREAYRTESGQVGWRCPAEPVAAYVSKGGVAAETLGRKCLCNALMADAGYAQVQRGGWTEPGLLTSGDGLGALRDWTPGYGAADVLRVLNA
ncbi:nitronate monooxygenase [Deinococcus radiotolerans]|uniref:2-nitropropane dioxygenase n=1 Tax=Deinococcus radiotolerans TaxID=1309407 RepID=A0ABQ2FD59_9DEIO|nr:nitronate monooxygenase [Deinococcus radiotolerans]GGK86720.1 2-nitropropane dioxygenase [Deinococcus radiotolerans]